MCFNTQNDNISKIKEYVKAPVVIASCCQEYRDQGLKVNGTYFIHPDKNVKPFKVKFLIRQYPSQIVQFNQAY